MQALTVQAEQPSGQFEQDEAPVPEFLPAGHGVQEADPAFSA